MDILSSYDFPGNVRKRENIIQRDVALETSSIILPESLTLAKFKKRKSPSQTAVGNLPPKDIDLNKCLGEVERNLLPQALQRTQWVKLRAAEILRISFRSLRYRLMKYGLAGEDESLCDDASKASK